MTNRISSRGDYYILKQMYLDRGVSANGKLFLVRNKKKKKEKKERNRECTARNGDTATSKNHIRRRISLQPPSGFRVRLYDRYPSRYQTPAKANTIAEEERPNREAGKESSPHLCPYVFKAHGRRNAIFLRDYSSCSFNADHRIVNASTTRQWDFVSGENRGGVVLFPFSR